MASFVARLRQFWAGLTQRQRVTLAATVGGTVLLVGGIAFWANRPDYSLLFGKLEAADASRIVEALRDDAIPYQLRDGGSAIHVPQAQVYELRLRFASEGAAGNGTIGYELFDGSPLGMTDFMQKLNYKRALEGELTKTIGSVGQIDHARVHLVVPERSAFREQQAQPSASVVLQLKSGAVLSPSQVEGITALVAGAVEGLLPAGVTVLDTRGNLLSQPDADDSTAGMTTAQVRAQRAVEDHLTDNGQLLLDRMLGVGKSVVRVSAALDFSKRVLERDGVVPDSSAVLSEEKTEGRGEIDQTQTISRSFEVTRTRSRREDQPGVVKVLTISVIVDQKRVPSAKPDAPPKYTPLSTYELQSVEALIKNAVGFNALRGDQIAVRQVRFDSSTDDLAYAEMQSDLKDKQFARYLQYGLIAFGLLAVLVGGLVFRSRRRKAAARALEAAQAPEQLVRDGGAGALSSGTLDVLESGGASGDGSLALLSESAGDLYAQKLSEEARARQRAHPAYEEVRRQVIEQPDNTAELIRSWLAEDVPA